MHEKNVVIFPCNRTEQREKLFNWVGPIYTFHFQIFAKADNNYMISNIEDAKKFKTIGVARDFYSDQVLTQLGFANLDRSTTPSSMLLKLINNRIQLMADDDLGMMGLLQEVNADNAAIKPVFRLFDVQTYVCLSHDTKPSIVAQWQHTLDEMRRDGSFSKLVTDRLPQQR